MKNRILDSLIIWGAMLIIVAPSIGMMILIIQGIDWSVNKLSELKEAYFTPYVPELAVLACALLCLGYFITLIYLSIKGRPEHPGVVSLFAYGSMMSVVGCWAIYGTSSQQIDLSHVIRCLIWLFALGIIGSRFGEDCKIAYVMFWPIFFLTLNEYFGTFPSLSMTGIQPTEKDFLEYHFGLTQLIIISHTALILAKPSSFKWFWFDAKKARDEMMRRILGPLEEAAALDDAPKTEGDIPTNK